jgi:PhnB protein
MLEWEPQWFMRSSADVGINKENNMAVTPYLFLDGRCEEAIDFYKKMLGAKVDAMMRFKENPEPPQAGCMPPNSENKIMHACMRIGDTQIMASDGRCTGQPKFEGFALTINAKDEAEADRVFAALGDGGQVQMPLTKTFFSPRFGMVADKFGVGWMVIVAPNGGKA